MNDIAAAIRDVASGRRLCDCGCGASFIPPASAPHKRFATSSCRDRFWCRQREQAAKAWKQLQSQEGQDEVPAQTMEQEP